MIHMHIRHFILSILMRKIMFYANNFFVILYIHPFYLANIHIDFYSKLAHYVELRLVLQLVHRTCSDHEKPIFFKLVLLPRFSFPKETYFRGNIDLT